MKKNSETKIDRFFERLDRSIFIDNEYREFAQCDTALPIGYEQTISQPTLVYNITCNLQLEKSHKVLEIGTGSGYQTAFLAEFSKKVYTIERIKELSEKAQKRLKKTGYDNIKFKIGDGSEGWREHSPFDRIVVTAAAGKIPKKLVKQLAPGGRMIVPVGQRGVQDLLLITKTDTGDMQSISLGSVMFVEFKGKYGWDS